MAENIIKNRTNQRTTQIIEFIRTYTNQHGYSPSIREIGAAVGLSSSSSVQSYINRLEDEGIIEKREDRPRTIKIVADSENSKAGSQMTIPIVKDFLLDGHMYDEYNISGYKPMDKTDLPDNDVYVYYMVKETDHISVSNIHSNDLLLISVGSVKDHSCITIGYKDRDLGIHTKLCIDEIDNNTPAFDSIKAYTMSKRITKAHAKSNLSVLQITNNALVKERVYISESQFNAWEKGHEIPNCVQLHAIANLLDVSAEWLSGDTDYIEKSNNIHILGEVIGLTRSFN